VKIAFHPRSDTDAAPRSPFGFLWPAETPEEPRPSFDYDVAFGRNLGWVTPAEQRMLRDKRVAIAGMGGVGGAHVLTFARLGVGHLHLADFDDFDLPNLNRQAGAFVGTLGRPKAEVMAGMGAEINPELEVVRFDESRPGLVRIDANVLVARAAHKRIVVGAGGRTVKAIGTPARRSIEALLDGRVHLALFVKVDPLWPKSPRRIEELGYR